MQERVRDVHPAYSNWRLLRGKGLEISSLRVQSCASFPYFWLHPSHLPLTLPRVSKVRDVVWSLSCFRLLSNPMDCNPLGSSIHGTSRQEYWSGLPFPFWYSMNFSLIHLVTLNLVSKWDYVGQTRTFL